MPVPPPHPKTGILLPIWLSDADWRKRHAALICLAQIAEGCARVMGDQVEGLVTMCLQGLRDPHPKVSGHTTQITDVSEIRHTAYTHSTLHKRQLAVTVQMGQEPDTQLD